MVKKFILIYILFALSIESHANDSIKSINDSLALKVYIKKSKRPGEVYLCFRNMISDTIIVYSNFNHIYNPNNNITRIGDFRYILYVDTIHISNINWGEMPPLNFKFGEDGNISIPPKSQIMIPFPTPYYPIMSQISKTELTRYSLKFELFYRYLIPKRYYRGLKKITTNTIQLYGLKDED